MSRRAAGGWTDLSCVALAALLAGMLALVVAASPARAGEWMQVSCVNPDGSAAPSDGWSSFTTGTPEYGSDNNTQCTPGSGMSAALSSAAGAAPVGASEDLEYQPPSGSRLIGGTVNVSLVANGSGYNASGTAVLYEPAFQYDGSDVFFQCASGLTKCANGGDDYAGDLSLPANRGGNFYIGAGCGGAPSYFCNTSDAFGAWALVQVHSAKFLLSSSAAPQGSGFGGSVLQGGVRGTAHVVFTATDPGGPGVYRVAVGLDGGIVSATTPNTNGGECAPVGTDQASGALTFDWQQPCPATEVVDVPVPTAGLPDGSHELSVTVTDAAQNSSTVLDQTITTSNPQTTPVARSARAVHARFVISWSWLGTRTTLRRISVHKLPRGARVAVRCSGRRCPRLRVKSAGSAGVSRLWRALRRRQFRAGDRLLFTVTAPGRQAERIELLMRNNTLPRARVLTR